MKKLEFNIDIAAGKQKVWDTIIGPESYKEWTKITWPNSTFDGSWKEGENIKFVAPGQGGTLANLVEVKPHDHIFAKHIAILGADGKEDRTSDAAKGWIGTTESYTLTGDNNKTQLKIEMNVNPDWAKMFENDWPKALNQLKKICEN